MLPAYERFKTGAPASRIRPANDKPINAKARYVLYWMIAARRSRSNFALDRAIAWAAELGLPLVVLEALRVDYQFASDRLHRFVIDGMADNLKSFSRTNVLYYPYVEPALHAGRGLLERFAIDAAVVVTDDYPCFFLPRAVAAASNRVAVRVETIDGNGLIPLAEVPQAYPAAVHQRRFMQRSLRTHLAAVPVSDPLAVTLPARLPSLPADLLERWPRAADTLVGGSGASLAALPIDHDVARVETRGGSVAAERALDDFVRKRLAAYHEHHNHPDDCGTSRLSPYLHFGHISAHQVFEKVMRHERWNIGRLAPKATGAREGWWGVGSGAEAFLDQLVVWRELAFNTCASVLRTIGGSRAFRSGRSTR